MQLPIDLDFLPRINLKVETVRLVYGSFIRLCLHTAVYYGGYGLLKEKIMGKKGALDVSECDGAVNALSTAIETVVSLLLCPVRYMAAVSTPRFLLDYMITNWSERLRYLDGFRPGNYASYALSAFANASEEWSLTFFSWQLPSCVLSLGKLILRRRRLGSSRCRTKRVLGALVAQILLRCYLSSFSIMIPEHGGEAVEAVVVCVLESMATSYLALNTWPYVPSRNVEVLGTDTNADHDGSIGSYDTTRICCAP